MKGQVFMIVSLFTLLFLFLLRINTQTVDTSYDSLFFDDFSNLKGELVKTVDVSVLNQDNIAFNLDDFITFSSDFYESKGYEEDVDYYITTLGEVTTIYLNISLSSSDSYLMESLIISRTLSVFP